ncbi:hypothetical protein BS78_07G003200 [Paspalum vaginatum]|nr:hypothetical protein BS78_07G003200 [Paspalum vaginatum]
MEIEKLIYAHTHFSLNQCPVGMLLTCLCIHVNPSLQQPAPVTGSAQDCVA